MGIKKICQETNKERTCYASEEEAKKAIDFLKSKGQDSDFIVKYCDSCQAYHVLMHFNNKQSTTCIDSSGKPKDEYLTKEDADKCIKHMQEMNKNLPPLHSYLCPKCGKWHVTHKNYD